MKTLAINVKERENVGKTNTRALRNQGNVPCVLYGGEKQVTFYAHENDFRKLVYTPDTFVVELDIDGTVTKAIMQDIQFHPVTDKILHIDFLEVFDDKDVTVSVPVILNGLAIGVRNGGKLRKTLRKLSIRSTPENLPDNVTIDITPMTIGEKVYVKDLEAPNFDILTAGSSVIVAVKTARGVVDEDEEEAAADAPATDAPAAE